MKTLQNETGRSMVEMLGVLAIIGVLSIGGIQGYTYAMNKYRANNILNELNIASQDLGFKLLTSRTAEKMLSLGNPYDIGNMTMENYPFAYGCGNYGSESKSCHQDETGYWTTIKNVPEEVCKNMLSETEELPNLVQKKLNGVVVEDGSDCGENNEITLLFNAEGTGELAKNCGEGGGAEPEEPEVPTISCPTNTSTEGEGGLAKTLTDEATEKAVQCYCVERDTSYNEETGECETLPETCSSNTQCNRGEYCDITDYGGTYCTKDTSGMKGSCRNASSDVKTPNSGTNPPFVMSSKMLGWLSAKNFCQALGKTMVELSDYECAHSFCPSGCDATEGYCHADTSTDVSVSNSSNLSVNLIAMIRSYGYVHTWTNTDYNTCRAYFVNTHITNVYAHGKGNKYYAVCK